MNSRQTFFHYKKGSSILHKLPAVPKILLMLALSISAFYIPKLPASILYVLFIFLQLLYFRFSVKEIFSDTKPALVYVIMLYLVCFVSNVVFVCKNGFVDEAWLGKFIQIIKVDENFWPMAIHLALSLQITAIFFRTTTVMQFTEGFSSIEFFITRNSKTPVATVLSLTITFIPRIAAFWQRLCYAWKNRDGAEKPAKLKVLAPGLFKISMHEAYEKSLARMNRC